MVHVFAQFAPVMSSAGNQLRFAHASRLDVFDVCLKHKIGVMIPDQPIINRRARVCTQSVLLRDQLATQRGLVIEIPIIQIETNGKLNSEPFANRGGRIRLISLYISSVDRPYTFNGRSRPLQHFAVAYPLP